MDDATQARLCQLNREFYERHAQAFSETRGGSWRGFERVVARVADRATARPPLRVLDVGCGNGRFAALLQQRLPAGSVAYLGIDASAELLALSRARHGDAGRFEHCDVLQQPLPRGPFDLVTLFGVLHHVPGEHARRDLLRACCEALAVGGLLALTFWRYDTDPRLARRRLDPAALRPPIDPAALDPGDCLMGFGGREDAVRYCHFAGDAEQARLLSGLPASPVERFDADGAGDRLNRYALLRRD